MDTQQNMSLVKKLFDEVYSKGNLSLMDQLFSNDVKLIDPAHPNFKRRPFFTKRKRKYV